MTTQPIKKQKEHYVSNKDFTEELTKYVIKCREYEAMGKPKPQMSNYIAECIMKLSNKLATKPCFNGYSWREEMIYDGIETAIRYIDRFNPEKSNNAFAYATQIIYNAFRRRLNLEKEQAEIKNKMIEKYGLDYKVYDVQPQDIDHYGENFFQNSLTMGLENLKDD